MYGFRICHACKMPFMLKDENRYTVKDRPGAFSFAGGPEYMDAFDCPRCGCQNILGGRLENFRPELEAHQ